jgi:Tfp pilus assembly protein FimT
MSVCLAKLQPRRRADSLESGFTLLELAIVVLILMVVGTIAIPSMVNVISNARLRGGATNLSGLLQNCRMLAVKENRTKTTRFMIMANGPVAYVKNAADTSSIATKDSQVQLGTPLTKKEPGDLGTIPQLTSTQLGFTAVSTDPSFNSRGLPCAYTFLTGACSSSGFVYYFKDTRPMGASGWTAVSISPAGRIKRWFWIDSAWRD